MQRLIAGGTGLIGRYLTEYWISQNIFVTILGRNKQKISRCFGTAVNILGWDEFEQLSSQDIKAFDSITNLCGVNIGDKRWSVERKEQILNSRVHSTKTIINKLIPLADQSPKLFNASAIGIYGLQESQPSHLPPAYDEGYVIDFDTYPDFLAEVARKWELATTPAKAHGVPVYNLRFGVVLTPEGGALAKLASPIKFGLGGPVGSGYQAFSWIHIQDLLRIFDFLHHNNQLQGAFNCVAPECITQRQLVKTIAKKIHRPNILPLPSFMIKLIFGEMGDCLVLRGQHVYPQKLLAHDFQFEFATIDAAIDNLF